MELFDYLLAKKKAGGGGGTSDLDWSAIGYDSTPQSIVDGYNYAKYIQENWNSSVTSLSYKFNGDKKLIIMPLVDTGNVQNWSNSFMASSIIAMPLLNTSKATNMSSMFQTCISLTTIPLLDTGSVANMGSMFFGCSALTTIPLLNTTNVTSMSSMFNSCTSLTTIPLLDTSSVTSMNNMFQSCPALTDESLDNILQMCINATSYTGVKTLAKLGFNSNKYPVSRIQALPHYQDFIDAGWTIGY